MSWVLTLFPTTPFEWGVQIVLSIAASYFIFSFAEYVFHRFLMHQGLPPWGYKLLPFLLRIRDNHRAHHNLYYKQFDYEPDPVGYELNLRFGADSFALEVLFFVPLMLLSAYYISIVPAIVFVCTAALHNHLWNTIHVAMHHAEHPYWTRWAIYKYLARNHYLHHQDTRTRFNIVCPFADMVLGSWHDANDAEKREIERLGFLK